MSYKFNPFTYHPGICAECGAMSGNAHTHITVAGKRREVPALYLCDTCGAADRMGHLARVTPISVYMWLTRTYIPRMTEGMEDGSIDPTINRAAGMHGTTSSALAIALAADVVSAIELTESLGRELCGLDPESEAEPLPGNPFPMTPMTRPEPAASDGAELAALLDLRREADGTVTYACPNPTCPDGNRHPLSFAADVMPVELVEALIGHLPE